MADTKSSADQNKTFEIVGYILPFLFFIPLTSDAKNDPAAKFHANQQLLLLIYWVGGMIVMTILPFLLLLSPIHAIIGIVLAIMGAMNANKGEMKELPVIGKFTLLK